MKVIPQSKYFAVKYLQKNTYLKLYDFTNIKKTNNNQNNVFS